MVEEKLEEKTKKDPLCGKPLSNSHKGFCNPGMIACLYAFLPEDGELPPNYEYLKDRTDILVCKYF